MSISGLSATSGCAFYPSVTGEYHNWRVSGDGAHYHHPPLAVARPVLLLPITSADLNDTDEILVIMTDPQREQLPAHEVRSAAAHPTEAEDKSGSPVQFEVPVVRQ